MAVLQELSVEADAAMAKELLAHLTPILVNATGQSRVKLADRQERLCHALDAHLRGSTYVDRVPEKIIELDIAFELLEESGYLEEREKILEERRSELARKAGIVLKS